MVSIQGMSSDGQFPPREESAKVKNDDSKVSVFYSKYDTNKDGIVSISEQKNALIENVSGYVKEKFNQFGLSLTDFINKIANEYSEIKTDGSEGSVRSADMRVLMQITDANALSAIAEIDKAKNKKIKVAVQQTTENSTNLSSTPPDVRGDNYDAQINYIVTKLEQMGIEVDIQKLANIMESFDYDMPGVNNEGKLNQMITPNAAQSYCATQYMNKDENGEPIDTHILDFIINKYIEKQDK